MASNAIDYNKTKVLTGSFVAIDASSSRVGFKGTLTASPGNGSSISVKLGASGDVTLLTAGGVMEFKQPTDLTKWLASGNGMTLYVSGSTMLGW